MRTALEMLLDERDQLKKRVAELEVENAKLRPYVSQRCQCITSQVEGSTMARKREENT